MEIVMALTAAVISIYLVVIGCEGWMLTRLNMIERVVLIAVAILIPFPLLMSKPIGILVGLILVTVMYLLQRKRQEKNPEAYFVRT